MALWSHTRTQGSGFRMAAAGLITALLLVMGLAIHQRAAAAGPDNMDTDLHAQAGAVEAMMDSASMAGNPHLKYTAHRAPTPEELARADTLIDELRPALEKYRDYHVALQDGYRQFLPKAKLPVYHFTNYREGFLEQFAFDPVKPTSLLYRKTPNGFELIGAMYTASRRATEDELDRRVPLSVATWHAHVNICLPPKAGRATADWTLFGLKGSIATKMACDAAGGVFYPQLFGWMVHVHPFETTRDKIWAH
ncbi:MAG TPA: hypothetical protein VEI24_06475 [Nitrospiria bacterium]|nr:hypothetical protein [Nitrospiria bacterium]